MKVKIGVSWQIDYFDPNGRILRPDEYVFTHNGARIESLNVAFNGALRRAGIEGAHFHTLQHTATSHMAMAASTPHEIAAQLRHKEIKTSTRYTHSSPKHKKKATNTLTGLTALEEKADCHKLAILPLAPSPK